MKRMIVLGLLGILFSFAVFAIADDNTTPGNLTENNTITNNTGVNVTVNNTGVNSSISDHIRENIRDRQELKNKTANLSNETKNLGQTIKANVQERNQLRKEIRQEIKENGFFTYVDSNGTAINFTKADGQLRFRQKEHDIQTTLNITEDIDENNNTILIIESGDKNRTIKIMPDTAAERALDRLKMKVCNEADNCIIELKDVGVGKAKKIAYELKADKKTKLFWLFNKKMHVESQVDAETGEVMTKKPWWAFLAKEED